MRKLATAVAVTLIGASMAIAAPNKGGFEGRGHGRDGFGRMLAQQLNLTDAQKAQIKEIRQTTREQNKAFFETFHSTMQQFWDAKKANDTAKIDSLKPTLESQRAQMKQIRDAEDAKIASVLTAEQNAKWQQLKADREAKHRNKQ